ncbi:hypothetical protein [Mycobacterium sp. 236(2023)]|uniref:hypothetical protein n=1 Tax=Mycobacterium sp. 236(2023) TaxID=3038163 RepID=UPI0024152A8B|nr:hypothetical protein [Mycobacterium sp. 236(2023)]MDG4665961.1 hypothetical protein [Mycobacterium sp. 236(2023)]
MPSASAAERAADAVARVRDDPEGRLALLRQMYQVPRNVDRGYLPYRRAASAFMGWQLQRGLLNPPDDPHPGSQWWRAVNESLLRDTAEARALAFGYSGSPTNAGAAAHLEFIQRPNARSWYLAHNTSVVAGYLANESLAVAERRVERFFLNVVLMRVLFAHAMVSAPALALGWLAPLGRPVGDPRVGFTGIFLSLARILPDRYPLGDDVGNYIAIEHGFGHALDIGVIQPRLRSLYRWSADQLGLPALCNLVVGDTPRYAWHVADDEFWRITPSPLAGAARRFLPA